MRREILGIAAAACFLAVGLLPARGDTSPERLKANIPFAFEVGKATLPAGNYTIEPASMGSWALLVKSDNGSGDAVVLSEPLSAKADKTIPKEPELVFQKTGNQYQLEEVTGPYLQREVAQPKADRESQHASMSPMNHERIVVRGS